MKVILLADVKGQGKKNDVIEVSDGYGKNFLIPRKLAKVADAQSLNDVKVKEAARVYRIETEKKEAEHTLSLILTTKEILKDAITAMGKEYTINEGDGAFYGPKIDFIVRDVIGRDWQLGTVQVDYNLPERFDLTYKGADDKLHRPIMIHRAPFGSMERFVAVLLEHTAGKFPLWLSPDQCVVLPISEKFNAYAEEVVAYLNANDVRAQIDDRNEKIGRKIRDNELKRIPYLLIVGEKEAAERAVSVRAQGDGDKGTMSLEQYCEYMHNLVKAEIEANKMH